MMLPVACTLETLDHIDVGDECWRRNVLIITCWSRFWSFWSPTSTIFLHYSLAFNIQKMSSPSNISHQHPLIVINYRFHHKIALRRRTYKGKIECLFRWNWDVFFKGHPSIAVPLFGTVKIIAVWILIVFVSNIGRDQINDDYTVILMIVIFRSPS